MKTLTYQTVNKSSWSDGPWKDEPDKKQWQDPTTGLPCLIVRGPSGALCGYVGVPTSHQAYGRDYDNLEISVHGGLTFADRCQPGDESHSICHIPSEGESDNVWWLGFDCAHCDDQTPGSDARYGFTRGSIYRDFSYVEEQVTSLAEQLFALS